MKKPFIALFATATIISILWVCSTPHSHEAWISLTMSLAALLGTAFKKNGTKISDEKTLNLDQSSGETIATPVDGQHDLKSLKLAFKSAKNINKYTKMDNAFKTLIAKSLAIKEYKLAFTIANQGHYHEARDMMYKEIFNCCVANGELILAEKATEAMHYFSNRDSHKQKLVDHI